MTSPFSLIPWNSRSQWNEANAALEHLWRRHGPALKTAQKAAAEIRDQLASIFPIMDRLCRSTCPHCTDICCRHACVWFDFKDLLFLHLAAVTIPGHQLIRERFERCRYCTSSGCRLDRFQRPFICTWYLCPAQTEMLRDKPLEWQKVTACLQAVKLLRRQMEAAFIEA